MSRSGTIAAAYLFDWIAGDPEWFPHPVRAMGMGISAGELLLRKAGQTPAEEFLSGAVLTVGLVSTAYLGTAKVIASARGKASWVGILAEALLAWTCLASRSLHDEASAVISALEQKDIVLARQRLARIVGRDTEHLNEREISRAVIETVAESGSDGVIAPLFYMAIGGAPLAMAYKAVNTLDSMIGHADERYFYFGKFAARLDDVANFIPSRLTALGTVAVSSAFEDAKTGKAINTWLRDGRKHKSPNAGQPESAMAGALQVQLGGENFYDGVPMTAPLIGKEFAAPCRGQVRLAIQIAAGVSVLGLAVVLMMRRGR